MGRVRLQITGVVDAAAFDKELEVEVAAGVTLRQLFRQLDKSGELPRRFFSRVLKNPYASVLVAGRRLDLPGELELEVPDGAEIAVVAPISGGGFPVRAEGPS